MHDTAAAFGAAFFRSYVDAVEQPRILEIGAGNVNGSLRGCAPSGAQYIGADLEDGPGVDLVLANPYAYPFDAESFEAIVSSSCLEHDAMFWLSFAEMCRVVRNGGFIYLNVPSNGTFHRYPTDNWRFYPDAGMALAQWGRRNGHDIRLIESFVGRRRRDIWNDCVMVFGKAQTQPPVRLLADLFPRSFNIRAGEEQQNFRNYCELTEDMSLQAWLAEKFKIVSDGGAELGDASIGGLIATLAEREAALSATQRRAAEREAATAAEIDAVRGALAAAAARAEKAEAEAQEFRAAVERAEAAAASAVAKSAAEAQEFKAAAERAEAAAGAAAARTQKAEAEAQEFKAAAERAEAQAQGLRSAVEKAQARAEYAARAAKNAEARLAEEARGRGEAERRAAAERALMAERAAAAEERLAAIEDELSQLRGYATDLEGERERLRDERDAVLASSFWRLTGPARRSLAVMPPGLRRQARRGARLAYWLLTPHRTRQRIAYLRSRRGSLAALPVPLAAVEPPATGETSPLMRYFDAEWYAERYGDVAETGLTAFEHFLLYGAGELRDPNPAFDSAWYLEAYPDAKGEGCVALEHFVRWGAEEDRRPFRDFDFDFYRQQAGIASASNLETYGHYLRHGRPMGVPTRQGRAPVELRSDDDAKGLSPYPSATGASGADPRRDVGRRTIDLDRWRVKITLADSAPIALERPIGIFVHLFYEELAEEIAGYLAKIDLPKKIYVSTASEDKRLKIIGDFERAGLLSETEIAIVPDCGTDIAPLLIHFREKISEHEICLKIHSKKSVQEHVGFGDRWRKHLYDELIGDSKRVRGIVGAMLVNEGLGVLMPEHYGAHAQNINIGLNYGTMNEILSKIDIDLTPDQKIEFPAGSMFWFRSDALVGLSRLGFNWSDFGPDLRQKDGTLAHGMERCFLFFCASAGKNWAFLPPYLPTGPKISRQELIRLIRASGAFDEGYYRATYSDLRDAGVDPIEHWVDFGCREGRYPSDPHRPNPTVYNLVEFLLRSLPVARSRERSDENEKSTIWGHAAEAQIRCPKTPIFDNEVALFVTHSPDGRLKPHVPHFIDSLRRNGIAVVLIVNADEPSRTGDVDLSSRVDGLFIRQNIGFDFAAWAHVIQLHRELLGASLLYWINDSLIGPVGQSEFSDAVERIRSSEADVLGLTENLEQGWHLQSFFLAFKARALLSAAFGRFLESIVCYKHKQDVIDNYEVRLATVLKVAGLECEPVFRAADARNQTIHRWKELLDAGFPFVKAMLLRNAVPGVDARACLDRLSAGGFDLRLVGETIAPETERDAAAADPPAAQAENAPAIPSSLNELENRRFCALEPLRTDQDSRCGPRVTIVTDSINSGLLYGGVATAIILAALLARRLRADLRLVTRHEPAVASNIDMILRTHGIPWDGDVECLHSPPGPGGRDVPVSPEDLFLTTSWWTTRATRAAVSPTQIAYLLQEDERMFYPLGDDYLLCAETLSDPSLLYVVNSNLMLDHLQSEGMAPGGIAFQPAFPSLAYYLERRPQQNEKRNFFFYARPNNLRNLFWRGLQAIGAAIEQGVLDPEQWNFYFVGKDVPDLVLPRNVRPHVLQNLPWPEYAALVRRIDVGLSLMYTPHPSYPPLDLAASGAVVVTNRYGSKVDLSGYSPNILCVEPSVPALVEGLRNAVALAENPATRAINAARFGLPREWATTLAPVLDRIIARQRSAETLYAAPVPPAELPTLLNGG